MAIVTKNAHDNDAIRRMVHRAFPGRDCIGIRELTEGYFNVAYLIRLDDDSETVLKIAPVSDVKVMTYEKNIMQTEVTVMNLLSCHKDIPSPKVLYSDNSCFVCNAPYFFMEKLGGNSLDTIQADYSASELREIYRKVGALNRVINDITNNYFGYISQPDYQGRSWFPLFHRMLTAVLEDAASKSVELGIHADRVLVRLEQDQAHFSEVKTPRLVHWDLWSGNVFMEGMDIVGLIDWERALWADPLIEVGFRSHAPYQAEFMSAYGKPELSSAEKRRVLWYDFYLFAIVAQEYTYRSYDSADSYHWATGQLRQVWKQLEKALTG